MYHEEQKLKELLKDGFITDQEYNIRLQELTVYTATNYKQRLSLGRNGQFSDEAVRCIEKIIDIFDSDGDRMLNIKEINKWNSTLQQSADYYSFENEEQLFDHCNDLGVNLSKPFLNLSNVLNLLTAIETHKPGSLYVDYLKLASLNYFVIDDLKNVLSVHENDRLPEQGEIALRNIFRKIVGNKQLMGYEDLNKYNKLIMSGVKFWSEIEFVKYAFENDIDVTETDGKLNEQLFIDLKIQEEKKDKGLIYRQVIMIASNRLLDL
eukprot:TRINITY_DN7315_c0_g1_i3.p1 TRINITY_DN7315_c0_g1~~TRINITY_DN7315_c0_g1_i3.p1  ORF type:complete len:265 (-),score=32.03 TRINITY_DN7315_c0_g1_i3:37-831(-)